MEERNFSLLHAALVLSPPLLFSQCVGKCCMKYILQGGTR
jgi:hypothetical protein